MENKQELIITLRVTEAILLVVLFSILMTGFGAVLGMLFSKDIVYINHYHDEEVLKRDDIKYIENFVDKKKKITK